MNAGVLVLGSTSTHECGSTGTLYLFLTYVEVDLLSWGGWHHPDSQGYSLVSLLENNHRDKAYLNQTGVIIRTNAIGTLLQQHARVDGTVMMVTT